MDLDQLIEKLPLDRRLLSVTDAADILGGPHWIAEIMHLVKNGHWFSWTHSPAEGEQCEYTNNRLNVTSLLPRVGPETNPAEVIVKGEEVLWRWCHSFEERLQGGVNPSKESVEERLKFVNDLASRRTAQALQTKGHAQVKPLQRTTAQENEIICEIRKQGYDPLALPKNPDGKSGVKASICSALFGSELFIGPTIFNKAWERLTASGEIVIKK